MNCSKCNKPMPDNASFCPRCGSPVEPKVQKDSTDTLLPPVPPLFSRPVPSGSRRREQKAGKSSRGTGCLVISLIFFFLCAAITALLLLGSLASIGPFAAKSDVSSSSTLAQSSTSESTTAKETTTLPSEQSKSTKESLLSQSTEN